MTLPDKVQQCLRETGYWMLVQSKPVKRIVVHEKFDPKVGAVPVCTINFGSNPPGIHIDNLRLDEYLIDYIIGHFMEIPPDDDGSKFSEAFSELWRYSGSF